MTYAEILLSVVGERWAIQEQALEAMLDILRSNAATDLEARVTMKTQKETARREGSVALIPMQGVISNRAGGGLFEMLFGGTSNEALGRYFMSAVRDPDTKAIVLDVNSPGGAVNGTSELSDMIFSARGTKPIIAHVNANALSAAYWAASAADEIVVTPSGSVGSIGVFGTHTDLSGAMEQEGVKKTLVSAGKFKTGGNPYEPLSDDARARMQQSVDAAYGKFVGAVARNRKTTVGAVRDGFGQGAAVDADDALAQGMVDRIGTLDETLQRFGVSIYPPAAQQQQPPQAQARRAFATQREKRALSLI